MDISSCAHCLGNDYNNDAVSDSDIPCSECVIMLVSPSTGKVESFVRVESDPGSIAFSLEMPMLRQPRSTPRNPENLNFFLDE